MRTALDSSVILDVITDDPLWAIGSESALQRAISGSQLVIGECVLAEITPAFQPGDLEQFLQDWKILFIPSSLDAATCAGQMFATYLERGGKAKRVVPDFLIGAHAQFHADRLLVRDRGYFRDYFSKLDVIEPSSP